MQYVIKKFFLFITCLFFFNELRSQEVLKLLDSIVTYSNMLPPVYLSDINYSDSDQQFSYVFFKEIDSTQNQYEIIHDGKFSIYSIHSNIEVAEKCGFYLVDNGYLLLKYWGDRLIYFNNTNRQAIPLLKNPAPHGFRTGANVNLYGKADGYVIDSMLLLNCYKPRNINYKWKESKILRSLEVYYHDPFLFWIDLHDQSVHPPFANYPKKLSDNVNLFRANMLHYFCVDVKEKKIFVSFGGSPTIFVYSFDGSLINNLRVPGHEVDSTRLFYTQCSLDILRFPDYFRLGLDVYAEVNYSGSYLFRTYRKALPYKVYRSLEPEKAFDICRSPQVEEDWAIAERSKRKYLQQIETKSQSYEEFKYPYGMDVFLGYNQIKKVYYFRKYRTNKFLNEPARVYIFKSVSSNEDF